MTITREQVADLHPGDVIELTDDAWRGAVLRGPLWSDSGDSLNVALCTIRGRDSYPHRADERTLTVISRAPRPFYVNSDRDHPEPGDVVRNANNDDDDRWWCFVDSDHRCPWLLPGVDFFVREDLPARLRLLIDGTTGLPPEEARR